MDEDDLLPLSGLSHTVFCERRAALVHFEGIWAENVHTVEGTQLHEAVDEAARRAEARREIRTLRAVHLRSMELGVSGIADVVELHADPEGVPLFGKGRWRPYPVEYKRGKPKPDESDTVQLCAQGMALEEMLGVRVPAGSLFYGKTRRRMDVTLDEPLRAKTREVAARFRRILTAGRTPPPVWSKRCEKCSLLELCGPRVAASAASYLELHLRGP